MLHNTFTRMYLLPVYDRELISQSWEKFHAPEKDLHIWSPPSEPYLLSPPPPSLLAPPLPPWRRVELQRHHGTASSLSSKNGLSSPEDWNSRNAETVSERQHFFQRGARRGCWNRMMRWTPSEDEELELELWACWRRNGEEREEEWSEFVKVGVNYAVETEHK